ncbi:hypothetical protein KFK09_012162 [Dendrobium nobile]|uniref:CP12 domain-containing protein n=1 Tax=Dendrobium nobile TaxID=94219 RepID=A0A8T3BEL9_DENNO|nr:hypothetical protein KFK09_012162 [Dendrobium nobile]
MDKKRASPKEHQPPQTPSKPLLFPALYAHPLSLYLTLCRTAIVHLSSPYMATNLSVASLSATSTGVLEAWSSVKPSALPQRSPLFASRCLLGKKAARLRVVRSAPSTPGGISEKVSESIKKAEEACDGDEKSGECAAAWDEVEELSAAASHARDRAKEYDPLENYCKDNPETNECRTFDN